MREGWQTFPHTLIQPLADPTLGDGGERVWNVQPKRDDAVDNHHIPRDARKNTDGVQHKLHIKGEVCADQRHALEYRDKDIQPDAPDVEAVGVAGRRCELDEEDARCARV